MSALKKRELFKDFLEKNKVLLVDKSGASRRRLMKTLIDMGSSRNKIFATSHYEEALEIIGKEKPKLVLSDFSIKGGSGFDLFKEYKKLDPEMNDTTLVLVTSNISQSAVAKAAEEDVDSFIIKPYTVKSLEKSLIVAVINKLYPSKYMQTIEKGKKELFEGEYETAAATFQSAFELSNMPSLAYFYHGQAQYFLELAEEAKGDYQEGLAINAIHFKCQVGLFELLMKQERYSEAYDVVRNIAKYFPANPDRLKQVIRLAIMTENFEDVAEYYELFTQLEERPEDVINYVCSGLYVLGRFFFTSGKKDDAKDAYEKLAVSCMGEPKFLRAMITKYAEEKMFAEAEEILQRFPTSTRDDEHFLVSNYIAKSGSMSTDEKASSGLELFNNGHKDPVAARIMIDSLFRAGSKRASEYLDEALRLWPDEFVVPKNAQQEPQAA